MMMTDMLETVMALGVVRDDHRCLYLGWLRSAQDGGLEEDKLEPPVPAGLEELSGPLHALIEFLEIDEDLVEVAAQASKPLAAGPSRRELSAWIRGLPERDKSELLITAVVDQDERWRNDLVRRRGIREAIHRVPSSSTSHPEI